MLTRYYLDNKEDGIIQPDKAKYKLVGAKSHKSSCVNSRIIGSIDNLESCECPVILDSFYFVCPKCGNEGFIYLKGGLTVKDNPRTQSFDLIVREGKLYLKQLFGCVKCKTRWKIANHYLEDLGYWQLPEVEERDLPVDLQRFKMRGR